jgi:uncharacterized membrane protein YgcG
VSRRQKWIVVLPIAALLVAGCGGGGDDESTEAAPATTVETTTALTKEELIEQGDAICAEVNAAVGTVGSSSTETSSPAAQAASLYSGMIASLNNLGTPQESSGYTEFSGTAEELASAEDEVQLAAEREDVAALETAESNATAALAAFQAAAEEYGFEECSAGPSAPPVSAAPETGEAGSEEVPEEIVPEEAAPEEAAPEVVPETGGAGGTTEGGGTGGGTEGGSTGGGESGGIGPG